MMKKRIQQYDRDFKQPVHGNDPITKGHFTIDWAFVITGWSNLDSEETLDVVSHITIDGNDNPFYEALIKTPLLIQDHPLSVNFKDGIKFIKVTEIGKWEHLKENKIIKLHNTVFEFLDNLNYLESITDFKDQNLL